MADKMTHFELVALVEKLQRTVEGLGGSDVEELKTAMYPQCPTCGDATHKYNTMQLRSKKVLRSGTENYFECSDCGGWLRQDMKTQIISQSHITARDYSITFSESDLSKREQAERETLNRELSKADMTPQEAIVV